MPQGASSWWWTGISHLQVPELSCQPLERIKLSALHWETQVWDQNFSWFFIQDSLNGKTWKQLRCCWLAVGSGAAQAAFFCWILSSAPIFQFLSWIELISKHWRWVDTGLYGSLPWKPGSIDFFIPKVKKKIDKLNRRRLQVSTLLMKPNWHWYCCWSEKFKDPNKKKYPKSPDFRKKVCLAQTWFIKNPFQKKKKKKSSSFSTNHVFALCSPWRTSCW